MTLRRVGSRRRTAAAVLALLATAAFAAGCGGDQPGRRAAGGPTGSSGPSSTASASAGSGPLALAPRAAVTVASGNVGPVALGDGSDGPVVFPYSADARRPWDRVGVADLDSDGPTPVAESEWPDGLVNWVASTAGWVAYVDQSAEQSDARADVLWRIWALDTATGEKVQLASNGDRPDAFVPIVLGRGGYFYWTSAEPDRTARESLWKPGWDRPRDLLRHTEMTPGSETLVGDRLVYLGPNGLGRHGHTTGGDCWSVPLAGGEPTPITHTALAMGCAASGDAVVWTQHIEAHPRRMPASGVLDDPYTVWTRPLDGGAPTLLHRGYVLATAPVAGDGFASWNPDGRPVVRSLTSTRTVALPKGEYAVGGVASGRLVAFTTRGPGSSVTVHVDEVTGG